MRIAVIHGSNQGFFPRFYQSLKDAVEASRNEIRLFVPNSGQNRRRVIPGQQTFGTRLNWHLHYGLYQLTGRQDCWSHLDTWDLLRKLKEFNPDIIHLHVVNQCQINFPVFVNFVNRNHIPVVWTFHDCRTFTGSCPYFDEIGCERWKTGCHNCPDKGGIYVEKCAKTEWQWAFREKWFNAIDNLTIVTPSQWLANLVKESFLASKKVIVLNNGIDTSDFSEAQEIAVPALEKLEGKIVLGVAVNWEHRKGLDSMLWLSQHLPKDYHIVLVGGISPELKITIPGNITCIPRTSKKSELIALYQRADVFVNPTLADNFPTVNIEALGAGLSVVTFNTGGSAECIDVTCGISVEKGNDEALLNAVVEVCTHKEKFSRENCIIRSRCFSLKQFEKYVDLYDSVLDKNE